METIKINIDGRDIETQKEKSILQASLDAGIYIPHLCYHADLSPAGVCRLCIVRIDGIEGLPPSCITPAEDGMKITTRTGEIEYLRWLALELMLAGHPADCSTCVKYLNCELQSIKQYLAGEQSRVKRRSRLFPAATGNPLFIIDPNRCVLCGRCVRSCHELRGTGVLFYKKRGKEIYIGTASDLPLADSGCRFCGACAEVCPTGAIMDKEEYTKGKNRKTSLVPCRYTCPAEVDVPGYIRFIRENNFQAAAAVIREKVPFPGVLGYVCDHPCEDVCRRGAVNQPVAIRELKRFAVEKGDAGQMRQEDDAYLKQSGVGSWKTASGKKVAVIGSGPAGLTAAYYLVNQGHEVTVFESFPSAGGMLRLGIPEYRLPREVIDKEISLIENRGVEIRTNARVESIDKLFEENYQSVLVAIGTHRGQKLAVPGYDYSGVLIGVDFLREVNLGHNPDLGNNVVVLGGGNVAFDCARVARRLGAGQVRIACLETDGQMPAAEEEIEQGIQEGISIYPSRTFSRILGEKGKASGVECLKVVSFSFDEEKNLQVEVNEDSRHILEADTVIFATGQHPEIPPGFGLATSTGNLIELDPFTLSTCREGVFAAGDAVNGTSSVIKAIASGRKAAKAVDRFLGGSGNIDEKLAPSTEPERYLGPGNDFAALQRFEVSCIKVEDRLNSFQKVASEMDVETACGESGRCLQCDLRLKMTPVKFWGSY